MARSEHDVYLGGADRNAYFVLFLSVLHAIRLSMPPSSLPETERLVLELLLHGPDFGLNLVARSDGRLKRGTVYVTLGRMERKGFITSEQEPRAAGAIGLPRRIYRVTPLGKRALRAWTTLLRTLAPEPGA